MNSNTLHLFEGVGIELEYMIVSCDTLDVAPVADELLHSVAGRYEAEVEVGPLAWSNELALHVLEFKTNGPTADMVGATAQFQDHVTQANAILERSGARLMPTAMHPWMDPHRDLRLWPHEHSPVYEAFNRIFDCRGHGWANLQSTHLNLPFGNDAEFAKLHAAIRLVLPLIPALAASSPIMDGKLTGLMDTRLDVYRHNAARIPSVTGLVIPEPVSSHDDYQRTILEPMYHDIAPHDAEGTLQYEWLNARGAIARFDRQTIEIRLIDVQEAPRADIAVAAAIIAVLKALVENNDALRAAQRLETARLAQLLQATQTTAEQTLIEDREFLAIFDDRGPRRWAGELWWHLQETWLTQDPDVQKTRTDLTTILNQGPLARRIATRLGAVSDRTSLQVLYGKLCDCLGEGRLLVNA